MKEVKDILADHNLRVTRPRIAVFAALESATKPASIANLIQQCPSIDRVSIYRTIDLFLRLHIVESVSHGWKHRYELAAPLRPHHHHLLCVKCGKLTDIHSATIEQAMANIATDHGFAIASHTFEIAGLCQNCQIKKA